MKLVVGLGNPGTTYQRTRHNIAWLALDVFAEAYHASAFQEKKEFHALIAEARVHEEKILLVKPTTYMNASGNAVRALMNYFHCSSNDVLIIQDEMDFAPGVFALLAKGSPAGHNGITSIHEQLQTTNVNRLRIGIGRPVAPIKKEDYVLGRFTEAELDQLQPVLKHIPDIIEHWITQGVDKTMNAWNGV